MREYEIMVITKPDLPESEFTKTVDRWETILKTGGGQILKKDLWGAKRLAYPIQKFNRGVYHVYNVMTPSDNVKELDRVMRIDEGVLRNLSLLVAESCDPVARKAELDKQESGGSRGREFERGGRRGFGGRSDGDEGSEGRDRGARGARSAAPADGSAEG